jgi:magnesium transporter
VNVLRTADPDAIDAARARGEYVWVDLVDPSPEELARIGDLFGLHRLALEDSEKFDQLPKIDHYRDWLLLVFYGARLGEAGETDLVETHLFVSDHWVITVRRDPCLSLDQLRTDDPGDDRWIVYRVIDALADSFFPVMHELERRIEALEDAILGGDVEGARHDIVGLRRPVLRLNKVLIAQRDVFDRSMSELTELPGLGREASHYFRDVQDHLHRLTIRTDSLRERLTSAIHMVDSVVNTRLAAANERLTLIATIFLPLTAVASFFGMNFSWMIDAIDSLGAFLVLGIGLPLLTLIVLIVYIRRHGYLE